MLRVFLTHVIYKFQYLGNFIRMTRNGFECSKHYTKIIYKYYLGCEYTYDTYISAYREFHLHD